MDTNALKKITESESFTTLEELKLNQLQLETLNGVNRAIINGASAQEIVVLVLEKLHKGFPDLRAVYSKIKEKYLSVIYSVEPENMPRTTGLSFDVSIIPEYFSNISLGKVIEVEDLLKNTPLFPLAEKLIPVSTRAILEVPFNLNKNFIGLICLNSPQPRIWKKLEINFLKGLADSLTVALKGADSQEKILKYESQLERMFSSSSELLCFAGKDGYFKSLSVAFEEVLGYSLKELYSIPFIEIIHIDDREKTFEILKEANKGQPISYFENRWRAKDGSYKWLAWNLLFAASENEPTYGLCRAQDITEKKRFYNELETLSLVASKTDNAVMIVDKNGLLEWVNVGFSRLTGYLEEEVLGKTPEEVLQGPNQKITTGIKTTAIRKPFNEKIQGYNKNGQPYWVSTSITPIFDNFGDIERFIIIETNITKQHLIENKILENEARLSSIINLAMDAIITFDSQHKILVFNSSAERVFLCSVQEALGQTVEKFIPDISKHKNLTLLSSALSDGVGVRFNKEKFSLEATLSEVKLGKETLYTIIIRDTTDRKLSEKKLKEYALDLEKINKELDQFAYVVSHDLKAPLRGISHLSEWLEEDLASVITPDVQHKMGLIRNRVNRMEALINAILKYSRIGRTKPFEEKVNVKTLIEEIIQDLDPLPSFSFELDENLPTLITERTPLGQVFSNLISNAIKYHGIGKGLIKIGAIQKEPSVYEFYVEDDGSGIDPRYHEKIFIIFQTLEAKNNVESTGIGLAIVKKIVESQGGLVWLKSEIGKGSTFYFTWPEHKGLS